MRISRLPHRSGRKARSPRLRAQGTGRTIVMAAISQSGSHATGNPAVAGISGGGAKGEAPGGPPPCQHMLRKIDQDRKSVVSGKRVSVRVDPGGRRIIKKKNTIKNNSRKKN